jgi:hypothetical protein
MPVTAIVLIDGGFFAGDAGFVAASLHSHQNFRNLSVSH